MRPVLLKSATLLLLAITIPVGRADAQRTSSTIAVAGGLATDQRGVRSSALTLAPSALFTSGNTISIAVGGNATRYTSETFSLGGGLSFTALESLGRFAALSLSAAANATSLHGVSRATFAGADVTPALELRLSALALYGGVRAATGAVSAPTPASQPTLPLNRTKSDFATIARSGIGPVYGGVLSWTASRATLRLGVREERLRINDLVAAERSGNASLSIALTPMSSLEIGAGAYEANRVLGTPAGEYVSAGLAFRFGGSREAALPKPRGVKPVAPGITRLSIRAPSASRVEIAGDFNEWTPAPALRAENGVWYADLGLPPGQYRYAFRINGSQWRVPDGATAVDDGFGGKSAWLVVPERGPRK